MQTTRWIFAAIAALVCAHSRADVKVPVIFSDHMVLQRGMAVPVWGTAAPAEKVTVAIAGHSLTTTAGADGSWRVRLKPLAASARPLTLKVSASNEITLTDVLVGEVWLASGQSNMEMPVGNVDPPGIPRRYPGVQNFEEELKNANHPLLRLCKVERQFAPRPLTTVPGAGWQTCSPESVKGFSAVGYFYGRDLAESLQVPVGIIASACSSSQAEQWTSIEALARFPQFKEVAAFYQHGDFAHMPDYEKIAPKGKPSCLYNGGLAPLIPYAIRGAIWYQGESNADRSVEYRSLFPAMIADWRQRWGQGDFPFYFVQLAGFGGIPQNPGGNTWAELREAQALALAVPNTGMAVTLDIGMADFIHPLNKQEVGRRLGLVARAKTYREKIEASGPVFKSMQIDGAKIVLQFDHLAGGLVSRSATAPGKLRFFAVAGKDQAWHWADARIAGETVVLTCEAVTEPVAARYGWAPNIEADFFNGAGLPCAPFRTDDWPLTTAGKLYDPGVAFRAARQ